MQTQTVRYTSKTVSNARVEYAELKRQLERFVELYEEYWHDSKFGSKKGTVIKQSPEELQSRLRSIRSQMSKVMARLGTMADVYQDL
jgi:predicted nuclease with TOPRIM domain